MTDAPRPNRVEEERPHEALAWAWTEQENTEEAYESFVHGYPLGRYANEAMARLTALWRAAGRIQVDATDVLGIYGDTFAANTCWLLPGSGKTETFRDLEVGPQMVVVPAGSFMIGAGEGERDDEDFPRRLLTIAEPFAVGRGPVTRGQFRAFVDATKRDMRGGHGAGGWTVNPETSWLNPGFEQNDIHPVVCVNWYDAVAYAAWLEQQSGKPYRLLSETEWECCCRATTTTEYNTGNQIAPDQATYRRLQFRYNANSPPTTNECTTPVGRYAPNAWGLCDMHGNVYEWCADNWHRYYPQTFDPPLDGTVWQGGDATKRVLRGGSWHCHHDELRSARRGGNDPNFRSELNGFRVARAVFPPQTA
ncbi:MAG: formylglycine-generating enzyme family protein [Hyphomicrobium aestuarii]|nr:formylglycine-generating enzyme family protein [Hyphomicrobium aestuarii]